MYVAREIYPTGSNYVFFQFAPCSFKLQCLSKQRYNRQVHIVHLGWTIKLGDAAYSIVKQDVSTISWSTSSRPSFRLIQANQFAKQKAFKTVNVKHHDFCIEQNCHALFNVNLFLTSISPASLLSSAFSIVTPVLFKLVRPQPKRMIQ